MFTSVFRLEDCNSRCFVEATPANIRSRKAPRILVGLMTAAERAASKFLLVVREPDRLGVPRPPEADLLVRWLNPARLALRIPTQVVKVAMTPGSRWKCSSVPPAVRVRLKQPQLE
eukprot:scaffold82091_cov57-Phaeocystis_antarctica.AAC.3